MTLDRSLTSQRYNGFQDDDMDDTDGTYLGPLARSPLATRAWAFQERLLSPRVMHFARDQVFWECCQAWKAEDGLSGHDHRGHGGIVSGLTAFPRPGGAVSAQGEFRAMRERAAGEEREWQLLREREQLDQEWDSEKQTGIMESGSSWSFVHSYYKTLVERDYSRRRFTMGKDLLIAFSGVARAMHAARTSLGYLAGLWDAELEYGLAWAAVHENMVPSIYGDGGLVSDEESKPGTEDMDGSGQWSSRSWRSSPLLTSSTTSFTTPAVPRRSSTLASMSTTSTTSTMASNTGASRSSRSTSSMTPAHLTHPTRIRVSPSWSWVSHTFPVRWPSDSDRDGIVASPHFALERVEAESNMPTIPSPSSSSYPSSTPGLSSSTDSFADVRHCRLQVRGWFCGSAGSGTLLRPSEFPHGTAVSGGGTHERVCEGHERDHRIARQVWLDYPHSVGTTARGGGERVHCLVLFDWLPREARYQQNRSQGRQGNSRGSTTKESHLKAWQQALTTPTPAPTSGKATAFKQLLLLREVESLDSRPYFERVGTARVFYTVGEEGRSEWIAGGCLRTAVIV